jgi:hypothetical protein
MPESRLSFALATSCEEIDFYALQQKRWKTECHADPICVNYGNGYGTMYLEEHSYSDILRHMISDCGWNELNMLMQELKDYSPNQLQETT